VISSVICISVLGLQKVPSCGERQHAVTERPRASRSKIGQEIADSKGECGGGGGRPLLASEFCSVSRLFPYKTHIVHYVYLR